MRLPSPFLMLGLALAGCAGNAADYALLLPRAGEAIDPRVPVVRPMNARPASAALLAELTRLVATARAGDAAFAPAIARAQTLAASAGAPQSESWIVAQQALSAAIEARLPTATALGDIDALSAKMLQENRGIAPNDLEAIEVAAKAIAAIDQRQSAALAALSARLRL